MTDSLDAAAFWTAASRTMPPFPTCSRPASNCGFTRTIICGRRARDGPGKAAAIYGGQDQSRGNKRDIHHHQIYGLSDLLPREIAGIGFFQQADAGVVPQAKIDLAMTGIDRDDARCGPRCKRQSVNPPVEVPTSRQIFPLTSICQCPRASSSLSPPRLTNFRSSPKRRISAAVSTAAPDFSIFCPFTNTYRQGSMPAHVPVRS